MTAAAGRRFSASYENLRPLVRWYEWGGKSIAQIATPPGRGGADESPLWKVLDDANHKPHVRLLARRPAADRRLARRQRPVLRRLRQGPTRRPTPRRATCRRPPCSRP